jgi:hypothetical protein
LLPWLKPFFIADLPTADDSEAHRYASITIEVTDIHQWLRRPVPYYDNSRTHIEFDIYGELSKWQA